MNADERRKKSQHDKFEEAVRELETDQSQEHFDAALKRVAKASPPLKPAKGVDSDGKAD